MPLPEYAKFSADTLISTLKRRIKAVRLRVFVVGDADKNAIAMEGVDTIWRQN